MYCTCRKCNGMKVACLWFVFFFFLSYWYVYVFEDAFECMVFVLLQLSKVWVLHVRSAENQYNHLLKSCGEK